MIKKLSLALLCLAGSAHAYDNGYKPGDTWTLEESFLENKEGSGRFRQGDPKTIYNSDDAIWFYLEALPGDEAANATPFEFCGYHRIGLGWGDEQSQPPEQEPPRIEGYPYIVRGAGSAQTTIFVHPGQQKDLIVAWQAPISGSFKAEATFERGGELGDGQHISWASKDGILAEVDVEPVAGTKEIATKSTVVKKGDRLYFRVNCRGSANDDSGVIYLQVTYEAPAK
ncbi:hypothetical protein BH09VER1_BH09VER1_17160 [soil metagenome]